MEEESSKNDKIATAVDTEPVDLKLGEALFQTCIECHGPEAHGMKALNAPALVNQEAWYLERQLMLFKNGIRAGDPRDSIGVQMAAMSKTLVDENAIKSVVAYIRSLPQFVPENTLTGDAIKGKSLYSMICGACHGPEGKGNKILNTPSLVGVDDWYLERQFNNFKNGIRGSHPDDNFGAQMQPMARTLPDQLAIRDVIAYLQTFNQEHYEK